MRLDRFAHRTLFVLTELDRDRHALRHIRGLAQAGYLRELRLLSVPRRKRGKAAARAFRSLLADDLPPDVRVVQVERQERPLQAVLREAQDHPPDLVVTAELGGMVQRLVRRLDCTILIVPPSPLRADRPLLVPVELREEDLDAARLACVVAEVENTYAEAAIVYSVPLGWNKLGDDYRQFARTMRGRARCDLEDFLRQLPSSGRVRGRLLYGDRPVETYQRDTWSGRYSQIVVARPSRGTMTSRIFGSMAERLLPGVAVPVWIAARRGHEDNPARSGRARKRGADLSVLGVTAILFALWYVLSGKTDALHLGIGLAVAFAAASTLSFGATRKPRLLRLAAYLPWLLGQIAASNLRVARLAVSPLRSLSPRLVSKPLPFDGDGALLLLGSSITLTPGTVTVDIDAEAIVVHALDDCSARETEAEKIAERIRRVYDRGTA